MKFFKVMQVEKIVREFVVRADEEHEANVVGWDSEPEYHDDIDKYVDEVVVNEIDFEAECDEGTHFFDCESEEWLTIDDLAEREVAT